MKIVKDIIVFVGVLIVSYFLAPVFGSLYSYFFPNNLGGALPTSVTVALLGFPLAYIFFLTLLFTAFGGQKKYWWIIILLIPAAIFEVYFDFSHIYFPILLGLLGWLIGFGISRFFSRPNPQV